MKHFLSIFFPFLLLILCFYFFFKLTGIATAITPPSGFSDVSIYSQLVYAIAKSFNPRNSLIPKQKPF